MTTDPWDDPARVTDSPDRSVAEHVERYLASEGRDGYLEGGVPNLVLTTLGRRTGAPRRTALFFGMDGDRYVLVASGSAVTAHHPQWYLNVEAHPEVQVQVQAERFLARADTATGPERERLWSMMTALAPIYHRYEALTPREIPVVVLTRLPQQPG
ncbi:nitroreductase family deazaflavin-dependent oxidoreductase [Pseudonocardia nigra]|uniref:nitroreductase family deazaflavin-dependent oxidoreductase n=1 Tax=Pseudonocardia nigra TaxID=1921578 RepID=UPI001C5DB745|nr:nitroreductase family deazaflavin-dependent oxidoreductase [Pseudonocardia nigra]